MTATYHAQAINDAYPPMDDARERFLAALRAWVAAGAQGLAATLEIMAVENEMRRIAEQEIAATVARLVLVQVAVVASIELGG